MFNDISTPYGLFNAKFGFICKCFIIIRTIFYILPHFIFFELYFLFVHSHVSIQLYDIKYSYQTLLIYWHPFIWYQVFLFNTNNVFTVIWFIYYNLIQTIFKQIYLTQRWDPNRYNQSGFRMDMGVMAWRSTVHSPEFQNLTLNIGCNLVSYPGHLLGGWWCPLTPLQKIQSQHIPSPTTRQDGWLCLMA